MPSRNPTPRKKQPAEEDILIPDKLYFRIGEVAALLKLPAYVLRFWETEFPHLKPSKSSTGQRLYRKKNVEMLVRVKHLLYIDGYTIAGARQILKEQASTSRSQPLLFVTPGGGQATKENRSLQLKRIKKELEDVLGLLGKR